MTRLALRPLFRLLYYLQVHSLFRHFHGKKIVILMYHGFITGDEYKGIETNRPLYLDVEKLKEQIAYLKRHYNIIPLAKVVEYYTSGVELPRNSLVITIDDGYESIYSLAYPIVKKFSTPVSIFLTTNFIDKRDFIWVDRIGYAIHMATPRVFSLKIGEEMLSFDLCDYHSKMACYNAVYLRLKSVPQESIGGIVEDLENILGQRLSNDGQTPKLYRPLRWSQIIDMGQSGMIAVGSHSRSHAILTRCNAENMKNEVFLSRKIIEERTGSICKIFCYPNGEKGDFDSRSKAMLKEAGYSCGITTVDGMNDSTSDVFELKRFCVNSREDIIFFVMTISGIVRLFTGLNKRICNILRGRPSNA